MKLSNVAVDTLVIYKKIFYVFLALHTPKIMVSATEGSGSGDLTISPCITGGRLWDAVCYLKYFPQSLVEFVVGGGE